MNGYAGKILILDLTEKRVGAMPTKKYQNWMGGHGMGSAIFFDMVKDKTIDGFHPDDAVMMMTSPLSGTLVPAASGRTEVQGIGVQSYPIGWFTRSNLGGRFSGMLKFAGWDESSGYPKRSTLESLGLGYVADELDKNGKIGKE